MMQLRACTSQLVLVDYCPNTPLSSQVGTHHTFTDHSGQRERVKAGGEGDDRGWDSWMASPTLWTWVWASSKSWWWTRKPGVRSPWGCKESDMTEWLNWTWERIFGGEGGYINSKSAGYNWGTGGCGAGGAGEEESLSEVHPSVAGLLSKDPYGVLLCAVHDKYSESHTCDLNFPSNYTKKQN